MTQDQKPPADQPEDQASTAPEEGHETPPPGPEDGGESGEEAAAVSPGQAARGPTPDTPAGTSPSAASGEPATLGAERSRAGGAGLWLAVLDLLAIAALGAAGYLSLQGLENQRFSQQQQLDALQQTVNRLDVAEQSRAQWFADAEERGRETRRELAELQRKQAAIANRQEQNQQALGRLADQVQGGRHAWQRAEIEHLLLVANTRLQLQHDLDGARTALELAEGRLASLANPAYIEVREQIARELSQLEAVPRLDLQALALQLDSLSSQVDSLATRRPKVGVFDTELEITGGPVEQPWYRRLWVSVQEAVGSLVSIRRDVERREPLLPPDQTFYLRQNLRLQLESARLAVLQRDTASFRAALGQAADWLQGYFDTQKRPVSAALERIEKLRSLQLDPALPDISGSLNALRRTGNGA